MRLTVRPDPRKFPDRDDSGRIIYLGDVRKRRGTRQVAPDQHYLLVVALAAAAGWAMWLAVLLSLQPSKLLTFVAFFLPLALALAATGTLVTYALDWRRGLSPSLARSARRGSLLASLIVLNMAFQAAHRWTPLLGIISVAVVVLSDFLLGGREDR